MINNFFNSSKPFVCSALILRKFFIPLDEISFSASDLEDLSDLFKRVIYGLFSFLRLLKISKSSEVKFSDPSTINKMRLHSFAAIQA